MPPVVQPSTHSEICFNVTALSALGLRWLPRCGDERAVEALRQRLGVSDMLARVLAGRGVGIDTAADYLSPSLRASMPDPMHLKDMDKAVARLAQAAERNETVGIFGDYDVDGATSAALLVRYFRELGIQTVVHIPDRQKEGYGPNIDGLRALKARGAGVVVTVDCGASAFEPLAQAAADGIEVIVLDHHIGAAELPKALAVVNPNRCDEASQYGYLCAAGVVFLALAGLNRELRKTGYFSTHPLPIPPPEGGGDSTGRADGVVPYGRDGSLPLQGEGWGGGVKEPSLLTYLDLVALATVCDVVPLIGLNRAFVHQGLKILAQRQNLGLRILLDNARIDKELTAYHLGFILGPRINAGGRVGKSDLGVWLLTTEDAAEAIGLAEELEKHNAERKAIEEMVQEEATALAELQQDKPFIMVAGDAWHPGVIGIVAGRLKERFDRPVAVLAVENGVAKASARSVAGVDLGAAVAAARTEGLLLSGGGHAMAAGFSVEESRLAELHPFLEARLSDGVASFLRERHLTVDAFVSVSALTPELAKELALAAPYGMGNPGPRLAVMHARIIRCDIAAEKHLRVILAPADGPGRAKAVAFRAVGTPLGEMLLQARGRLLHLAGQLKLDSWQGREQADFHVEDAVVA